MTGEKVFLDLYSGQDHYQLYKQRLSESCDRSVVTMIHVRSVHEPTQYMEKQLMMTLPLGFSSQKNIPAEHLDIE